jgi:Fibronectin type III domain.
MEKRLKQYLELYRSVAEGEQEIEEREFFRREMLVQIQFFQHERLIHLIVTVLFALLAVITILAALMIQEPAVLLLCLMFFVLLIPYIRHYYILENGVQKLYDYYDRIHPGLGGRRTTRAKGYQICYSTSKKWKNKKIKLVTKNKVVIKNLKKKKTYYFRVRAYRLKGTKKVYGAWSSVKKIKIKK